MKKDVRIKDPYDHELYTQVWESDADEIKGVIQIIHGASEYMERYDEFATFLNQYGYHVVGHDQIGHGRTSNNKEKVFFDYEMGHHMLYEGVKTIREYIEETYPDLEIIMFGHSMGSFIGRYDLFYSRTAYRGAIFAGTGLYKGYNLFFAKVIAKLIALFKGKEHVSRFFNKNIARGHINKMIQKGLINKPSEWTTHDVTIRRQCEESEYCTQPFTIGANLDLLKILPQVQDKEIITENASSTGILFISGDQDGLGNFGEDAKKLHKLYRVSGYSNVEYKVFNNCRHEVINELDRENNYKMILTWIEKNI
ncbi:MAG: lysophospholipase [Candidatus Izimaplasma sp.]|nr:lysophospholipase [Candidatus Izimaplasma bacterium]